MNATFIWTAALIYIAGGIGTLIFNNHMIVGPIVRPLAVLRNALLWPIFLPILISIARSEDR